ncbi:MAG: tetratricopeptide repeat protein [Alphaproteobacteria bacterium]|nr:tetratricopeptide repeat protein [Alphaproteobacteria bacterium]
MANGADAPNSTEAALAHGLQQGLSLQRSGRHADAERLYRTLAQSFPTHPDVLQLLGLALKAQGKLAEAEDHLRRSLGANRAQPHVWNNLGNLLSSQRRAAEAVLAYREAIALNANYAEAWIGLGEALMDTGDLDAAEDAYQRARTLEPQRAAAQIGLAAVAAKREDEQTTDKLLRQVLARDPNNAIALHNLGVSLARRGLASEAAGLTERAIALRPGRPDMLSSHAFALQLKGKLDAAAALYRQALARDPLYVAAHENLSRLLWAQGKHEVFTADLDAAIARHPNSTALLLTRGSLLGFAERFADAREAFARALRIEPDNAAAHDGYARMSAEFGDDKQAVEHHARAVSLAPSASTPRANYGHTLLRFGEVEAAVKMLDSAVERDPADQSALGILTLALRAANDPREFWLADYERFARPVEVPVPRGYADMKTFNAELNRTLDALHDTEVEPIDQTLRKGTQTLGSLFDRRIEVVDRLRERLDEVIRDYIASLPDDDKHPFLRRKAKAFRYRTSWSSRLRDSGFHTTHVHPKGWISSAYYIALPDEVGDRERKQGWFTLGDPPFDLRWNDPVRRYIQPHEGSLVLFPSYFYHGTVPFHSRTNRTTIAFDVVPVSPRR